MLFRLKDELVQFVNQLRIENKTIGFVPTMGALHEGHLTLMQKALEENDFLVVSIFVNPTQFNNQQDLKKYPRDLNRDLHFLKANLNDRIAVYAPDIKEVYHGVPSSTSYDYDGIENEMEGANRPGHFNGVGTILEILFNTVRANRAYFGEKDFQQLQIVKKLVDMLGLSVEIIGCPISREENGLARSSRNERLSEAGINKSSIIYKKLKEAKQQLLSKTAKDVIRDVEAYFEKEDSIDLEYFTIADESNLKPVDQIEPNHNYRAFIVAHIEGVRLIDNLKLN